MVVEQVSGLITQLQEQIQNLSSEDISFQIDEQGISKELRAKNLIEKAIADLNTNCRNRIYNEFYACGPIEELLNDQEITEIIINNYQSIWFEKDGRLHSHNDSFTSKHLFLQFIYRVCQEAQVQFSLNHPMADGCFRGFRLHLVTPDLTRADFVLCLRRHPENPWTLEKLLQSNWCSTEQLSEIREMLKKNDNFIVVGGTGSGKTSLLSACLHEIPPNQRAVIIEDTPEIYPGNKISCKLLTRNDAQGVLQPIDQAELVRQALRMRPDRIIMGEIRGAEAKDLLLALSTGHGGCFASLHALTAQQALLRLEMLIQFGAPHWSIESVRNLIFLSLQKIVVVKRNDHGMRVLEGIYQLHSREVSGILIDRII